MVERAQEYVGEQLAGEVPDWHALGARVPIHPVSRKQRVVLVISAERVD